MPNSGITGAGENECGVAMARHRWDDKRRHRPGYCAECGYNLTGNVSGICPECGTRVAQVET